MTQKGLGRKRQENFELSERLKQTLTGILTSTTRHSLIDV
jgi:hypothetical protein